MKQAMKVGPRKMFEKLSVMPEPSANKKAITNNRYSYRGYPGNT
jgi:hypothetical protein